MTELRAGQRVARHSETCHLPDLEGLFDCRVVEAGGHLFWEAEPLDPSYAMGPYDAPPILRIPIEEDSAEQVQWAKDNAAEGFEAIRGEADPDSA